MTSPNSGSRPASTPPTWPLTPVRRMRISLRLIGRQLRDVGELQPRGIARRKLRRLHRPVDTEGRIVPGQHDLVSGTVDAVAFVEDVGLLGEHHEAMGEAARSEDLPSVLAGELHGNMLAECRTAAADVHHYVENAAGDDTDQLALRVRILQVQPAQHAMR